MRATAVSRENGSRTTQRSNRPVSLELLADREVQLRWDEDSNNWILIFKMKCVRSMKHAVRKVGHILLLHLATVQKIVAMIRVKCRTGSRLLAASFLS